MEDAYAPAMTTLTLTSDEQSAITTALGTAKPWGVKNDLIKSVKTKIQDHHLTRHGKTCCFCRTILHGGGYFMIDREHMLPKGNDIYRPYSFSTWNLSVSCKRCNMQFKGEDDSFVVNKTDPARFISSDNYLLLHPNFDKWDDHLCREARQVNTKILVKFTRTSSNPKGDYTYNYFHLEDLEINSFDEVQGAKRAALESESESVAEARQIITTHGQ